MTEPMDVDEANWAKAVRIADSLRARLRREREAIQKVRDELRAVIDGVVLFDASGEDIRNLPKLHFEWLADLDEVLKEGT